MIESDIDIIYFQNIYQYNQNDVIHTHNNYIDTHLRCLMFHLHLFYNDFSSNSKFQTICRCHVNTFWIFCVSCLCSNTRKWTQQLSKIGSFGHRIVISIKWMFHNSTTSGVQIMIYAFADIRIPKVYFAIPRNFFKEWNKKGNPCFNVFTDYVGFQWVLCFQQ